MRKRITRKSKSKVYTLEDIAQIVYLRDRASNNNIHCYHNNEFPKIIKMYLDIVMDKICEGKQFYIPKFGTFYVSRHVEKRERVFYDGEVSIPFRDSNLKGYYVKLDFIPENDTRDHMKIIPAERISKKIHYAAKYTNTQFILADGNSEKNTGL